TVKTTALKKAKCEYEKETAEFVSDKIDEMYKEINNLEKALLEISFDKMNSQETADYCKDVIIPTMEKLRTAADAIETVCDRKFWPYPSYSDLLFSVR
ncbi:MAG: hypothetical protein IIW72_07460, partial [Clostridia bacterium]|nr:hypothetical protein [Clostridia bacterium]